jgi:hypothetical protein
MTGVTLITTPKQEARTAFLAYRRAFREATDAEQRKIDEALMKGYRAIAGGQSVIDLHEAFTATGVTGKGYPKLAICRAHEQHCTVEMRTDGSATFYGGTTTWRRGSTGVKVDVPKGTFPTWRWAQNTEAAVWPAVRRYVDFRMNAQAVVPIIPAQYRPPTKLDAFHILWEADWTHVPHDPLLLKHLSGALYAVLAQWDLTPLERAVLAGRLR